MKKGLVYKTEFGDCVLCTKNSDTLYFNGIQIKRYNNSNMQIGYTSKFWISSNFILVN